MTDKQFEVFRTEMKRMRKENGLTQQMLAELVGCTGVYLGGIERGNERPSDILATKIADVFDVTVGEMFVSQDERLLKDMADAGRELVQKRCSRGFTINQVAGFLGIPREAYLSYEHGNGILSGDLQDAINRLYEDRTTVETVEVIKEVPAECPIGLETIETILEHIGDMTISKDEQRSLFRTLSEVRMTMLEQALFG